MAAQDMATVAPQAAPMLTIRGLSKTFPGTKALDHVDFDLRAGEVHALVGQNGCGKSTLIKVLAGYHQPDPGSEIRLAGEPVDLHDTIASHDAGFRFVHQDLGLVETLSAVENLILGRELDTGFGGRIRWGAERRDAEQRIHALGYGFDVRRRVAELRTAKWLRRKPRVLLLDEPTQGVDVHAKATIHALAREVAAQGAVVVIASSDDTELCDTCDRVLVMRGGTIVAEVEGDRLAPEDLGRLQLEAATV